MNKFVIGIFVLERPSCLLAYLCLRIYIYPSVAYLSGNEHLHQWRICVSELISSPVAYLDLCKLAIGCYATAVNVYCSVPGVWHRVAWYVRGVIDK